MKRYGRLEVTVFRRRVIIVSGQSAGEVSNGRPSQNEERIGLNDNSRNPITLDSAEDYPIIREAMRSLEQNLTPEVGAALNARYDGRAGRSPFFSMLRAIMQTVVHLKPTHFQRKQK